MHVIFRGVFGVTTHEPELGWRCTTGDWREDKTTNPATIARLYAGEKKHSDNPSHI